jgi:hypothetical protein
MSKDRKLSPDEAWDAVEKMALKEEAERVGALTDEELDRELERQGKDPKALRARGQALAERLMAKAPAPVGARPVVPSTRARSRWPLWLVAAVLGAIATTLVGMNRAAIVAWFQRSEEIRPDDRRLYDGARARAEKLRDEADERCARKLWGACEARLDEATKLDPGGESEERVRRMRDIVESAARAEAGPDKPDKPLRPR